MLDKIMYKKTTFIKTDLPDWYNKKSKIFQYYNFNGFSNIMTTDRSNAIGRDYHYLKNFDSDGRANFAFYHDNWSDRDATGYGAGIYRAPDSATAVYLDHYTDSYSNSIFAEWKPELSNWNYVLIEADDKNTLKAGFLISEPFKVNSNDSNGVKNVRGVFATQDQNPTLIKTEVYTSTSYSYSGWGPNSRGMIYFDDKNQDIKSEEYPARYWVTFKNRDEYPYKDLFKQVNINI